MASSYNALKKESDANYQKGIEAYSADRWDDSINYLSKVGTSSGENYDDAVSKIPTALKYSKAVAAAAQAKAVVDAKTKADADAKAKADADAKAIVDAKYEEQQKQIRLSTLSDYKLTDSDWKIIKPILDSELSRISAQGLDVKVKQYKAGTLQGKKWATISVVPTNINTDPQTFNLMSDENQTNWSLINESQLPSKFNNSNNYSSSVSDFSFSVTGSPSLGVANNINVNDYKNVSLAYVAKSPYDLNNVTFTGTIDYIQDKLVSGYLVLRDYQGNMVYIETIGADLKPYYKGNSVRVYGLIVGESKGDISLNGQPLVLTKVSYGKIERAN